MTAMSWWAPWAVTLAGTPVRNALVVVDGERIVDVRSGVDRDDAHGALVFDGCVLAPGFVNAHSHIEYAVYEHVTDALPFATWIDDHIHRKRRLKPEHMRASARVGAWEALAGGITTLGDASFSGDAACAMHEVGLRGRVYLEVFGTSDEQRQLDDCLRRLGGLPASALLSHGISPHAPYTVSRRLYELVAGTGLPWMTHLAESAVELEFVHHGRGPLAAALRMRGIEPAPLRSGPIEGLRELLSERSVVVHAVRATDQEIEVLATIGAPVAHCPRSNARLGCGVLDLPAMRRAGVRLALATDSPASAGPLDMFAEMRSAIELHRASTGDAAALDAEQALRMATLGGARVLGYGDLGTLTPGALADVVACHVGETLDPVNSYVLGGTPGAVRAVMIGGRIAWENDMNDLQAAREQASDARALVGLPTGTPVRGG